MRLLALSLLAALAWSQDPTTWCNPLPIPNYPIGLFARKVTLNPPKPDSGFLWLAGVQQPFRELADPCALWENGIWYLYPSVDMAWTSKDQGATWEHHPINIRDVGYAPTVVHHRDRYLLVASGSNLYSADGPLGPFHDLGPIALPTGPKIPTLGDPMLFSDNDGRLYLYWGSTPRGGIWGVELDADRPTVCKDDARELFTFRPDLHPWERLGEWNEDRTSGWIEGCWMVKHGGRYHLTYSVAGTQYRTYAVGSYQSTTPLGTFTAQEGGPVMLSPAGLVNGTGHGCFVHGPGGELWTFYTMRAGVVHGFERRIGMDRVRVDDQGLHAIATSIPQSIASPKELGWVPVTGTVATTVSSSAWPLSQRYAVDDDLRTWWQPATNDATPTLTCLLLAPTTLRAIRVIWRGIGLDPLVGVKSGPFRYRVEAEVAKDRWTTVLDRSSSTEDLLVDYREIAPTPAIKVRLVITGAPAGITPGVAEFTAFGNQP